MKLTEQQDKEIIELLAKGRPVTEIAEAVGTSQVTVYERLNQHKDEIENLKNPLYNFDQAINKRLEKIISVIDKLMDSPDENKQLKACEMVLKYASKGFRKEVEPEDDDADWEPEPGSHAARFLEEIAKDG